ncbi:MAG: hypothetical protein RJB01_895 [Actinomycetota bacterium]
MTEPTAPDNDDITSFDEARVRAALENLTHLTESAPSDDHVPADVWARMERALSAEAAERALVRAGVAEGTVADLGAERTRRRQPRAIRWTAPLVAVSAVVLGVAVVTNINQSEPPVVVAGEAQQVTGEIAPAEGTPVAASDEAEGAAAPPADAQVAAEAAPQVVQAGFIPPARKVMATEENFTSDQLTSQVATVLSTLGIDEVADIEAMPVEEIASADVAIPDAQAAERAAESTTDPAGDATVAMPMMVSEPQVLRECITDITESSASQALVVLLGRFNGEEAGVVVIPTPMMTDATSAHFDSVSDPTMHIYVVGTGCGASPARVMVHVLHSLQ